MIFIGGVPAVQIDISPSPLPFPPTVFFKGHKIVQIITMKMKASLCQFCMINPTAQRVWMYIKLASAKSFGAWREFK